MEKKIYSFINNPDKYVPILAKEIIEIFKKEANDENVEYSYVIDGTSKEVKGDEANTYFVFDTNEDTCIHSFKESLFDKDLEDIKEGSDKENKLMEEVRTFLFKICQKITNSYSGDLKETIRRVVLGGKYKEKTVPLSKIEVISIDIADYSSIPESFKYLLRIGKTTGEEINTDEVISFIQNRQEKTGMDIDSIFSIEKQAGNPLFKNVLTIESTVKFLNEITMYFFVDYSVKNSEKVVESEK